MGFEFAVAGWIGMLISLADQHPEATAKSLHGPPGFEFTVFASEPMVVNPTNMEVDSRGRVWVTEGLNYRFFANKNFQRVPGADKIKILEDTDGDGKADKVTVFAENIYPVPMGLAIQEIWKDGKYTGCRVFTGNSPDLLVFEDTNGDDKSDKREVLLTGFGGHDSDHGVHGMFLGPDGLLYFTQGDGKYGGGGGPKLPPNCTMSVTGKDGRKIENYKDGTVLRCNLDATGLELLATGLRNNYEVCVDSFGRIFASDNDDDGNRGCRMCWILPGAHYGYHTPGSPRHWGEENPANTPKIVGTGNGSPCGIMVYEGDLLPPEVRGAVLQVDAGTRQINLHPLTKVGASLRTEYKVLVKGDDPQFRPVDCCTAPDGSLMIADWYDAGVGGHRFTDQKTGRVYRLAPKGMKYERPKVDMKTEKGLFALIDKTPNVTTHFAATQAYFKESQKPGFWTDASLNERISTPFVQARRSHSLQQSPRMGSPSEWAFRGVDEAAIVINLKFSRREQKSNNTPKDLESVLNRLEKSDWFVVAVDRKLMYRTAALEMLVFANGVTDCPSVLRKLIRAWDGSDRFYLQAIRTGCQSLSSDAKKELFDALLDDALKFKASKDDFALPPYYPTGSNEAFPLPSDPVPPPDARGKLIGVAWVLESVEALPALQRLASERPSDQVQRGVTMALSRFRDPKAADAVFAQLAGKGDSAHRAAMLQLLGDRLKKEWSRLREDRRTEAAYKSALDDDHLRLTAVRTVPDEFLKKASLGVKDKLLAFINDTKQDASVREAAFVALLKVRDPGATKVFEAELKNSLGASHASPLAMTGVAMMLGRDGRYTAETNKLLQLIRETKYPAELRRRAVQSMAADPINAKELMRVHKIKALPDDVLEEARYFLNSHADASVRATAATILPLPKSNRPLDVRQLANSKGDAEKGRAVFFAEGVNSCAKCHRVQGVGQWVGPDLSAIGEKYPKSELLYHLVQPSGAVAFGYQNWHIQCNDGRVQNGLIVEETPERIVLRNAAGERIAINAADIEQRKQLPTSLMPDKLADPLKDDDIVDLLEFMSSLKQPVVEAAEYMIASSADAAKLDGLAHPTRAVGYDWRTLTAARDGVLDLSGLLKSQKDSPGLAAILKCQSPTAQQAELVLNTAIKAKVKVNGADAPTTPSKFGGVTAKIDLKQGDNWIVVRLLPGADKPTLTTSIISKRPVRLASAAGD